MELAGWRELTVDEAIAAATAAAWWEQPTQLQLENAFKAITKLRALLADEDKHLHAWSGPGRIEGAPPVLPGVTAWLPVEWVAEAIAGAEWVPKQRIHSFLGGIGADWDLADVVELIHTAAKVGWMDGYLRHDLTVTTHDGRIYHFEARRPKEDV